jgi:hypothetical protein
MASKLKIFDGTSWIDPCECNVHMRTTSGWLKLDPRNCPTHFYNGTDWCKIECTTPCTTCPEGFTLNPATNLCEQYTPANYDGTLAIIAKGCYIDNTYGGEGLALYDPFTFSTSSSLVQNSAGTNFINTGTSVIYSLVIPGNTFKAPVWYYRLNSVGIAKYLYPAWNKKKAYALGSNVCVFNSLLNKWQRYNCISSVSQNLSAPYNVSPVSNAVNWSGPFALNENYTPVNTADIDQGEYDVEFKYCLNITTEKTYHLGFAGDNKCKLDIQLNGVGPFYPVITTTFNENFRRWHVIPAVLPAGNHVIKLTGTNELSVTSTGLEIYDFNPGNDPAINPIEKFKEIFVYAPGTTTPNAAAHTADTSALLETYIVFSTSLMIQKSVPIPSELDPTTGLPYVLTCDNGLSFDYCNGSPLCLQTLECGGQLAIDSTTEINIWFDNSGSMDSTLTPLQDMQATILKNCLLPIYNNDSALYDQKVRVLNMSDSLSSTPWDYWERFIRCLSIERNFNRSADTSVGLVINLTFADESNDYGYGSTQAFNPNTRTAIFDSDVALAKASLNNASNDGYVIKGYAFRVSTGNNTYQGFRGLTEATFVNTGVYTPQYTLSDQFNLNLFKYNLDVTPGAAASYYKDRIIEGLQQLGIVVPNCP